MGDLTTLNVTPETWRKINRRKEPGDTVDDVLQRLIDEDGEITVES